MHGSTICRTICRGGRKHCRRIGHYRSILDARELGHDSRSARKDDVSGREKRSQKSSSGRGSTMFPGSDVRPFRSAGAGPVAGGKGWPRTRAKRPVSEGTLLGDEMHEDMTQRHHGFRCKSPHGPHGSIRVNSFTCIAHAGGWTRPEDFRHRRQRRRVGHRCLRRRRTSRTAQWRPLA